MTDQSYNGLGPSEAPADRHVAARALRALIAGLLLKIEQARRAAKRRKNSRALAEFEDWRLADIGLTRAQVRRMGRDG